MMSRLSGLAGGASVSSRRLLGWTLGFLLLPFVAGCGGREERATPDNPPAAVAAEATPAFNRDMHVIRELWKELQALEQATDPSAEMKRQTLRQALQERIEAFNRKQETLSDADHQFLQHVSKRVSAKHHN